MSDPKTLPSPQPPSPPQPRPLDYVVRAGDSLSAIAQTANLSLATLLAVNPQISNPNLIQVGQVIHLPSPPSVQTHVVQPGENLSSIASAFGVTLLALELANPQVTDSDLIRPGDVLHIP